MINLLLNSVFAEDLKILVLADIHLRLDEIGKEITYKNDTSPSFLKVTLIKAGIFRKD